MKKYMILAAAAALTLAGCAKVETYKVSENDGQIPIGFANYTYRALSRADAGYSVDGTTNTNLINATEFGVYGWAVTQTVKDPWTSPALFDGTGAPNFMNNIPVTFKGGNKGADGSVNVSSEGYYSSGNPIRYWPSGDKPDGLSFYAYYPVAAVGNGLTMPANGLGDTKFTVKTDAAAQYDFLVAPVVADQWYGHTNSLYSTGTKGTVDFTFKHTLTKVRFYFKTDNTDANTTITLTNAQLNGVYKTNTLTTSYAAGATANNGTFAYDWGTAEDAENFDVKINGATPSATNVALSTTATTCTDADAFLMVPQTIAANAQKITLTWTVETAGVTTTNTKTIDLLDVKDSSNAAIQWEKNKQVSYTFIIGPKPIYFTASVDDWTAAEVAGSINVQ